MPSVKRTPLQRIIDEEGITKADLCRLSSVNSTTVNGLCKGVVIVSGKVVTTKESTRSKIVNAVNKKVGFDKYTLEDIFPPIKKYA